MRYVYFWAGYYVRRNTEYGIAGSVLETGFINGTYETGDPNLKTLDDIDKIRYMQDQAADNEKFESLIFLGVPTLMRSYKPGPDFDHDWGGPL